MIYLLNFISSPSNQIFILDQRDEQRLFVKFLSLNTTEQDLKQCHANISNVHFLTIKNIKPNSKKLD